MTALRFCYVPTLRMKRGELMGLALLADDVAAQVLPRMILMPRAKGSGAVSLSGIDDGGRPNIGKLLHSHWGNRPVMVEASHVLDEFGRDGMATWYPAMFGLARTLGTSPVPLVRAEDFCSADRSIYAAAAGEGQVRLAFVVDYSDAVDLDHMNELVTNLCATGISAQSCAILIDFSKADLTNPSLVSGVIENALDSVQRAAPWMLISFQGTTFPDTNWSSPGRTLQHVRGEWASWCEAVKFCRDTAQNLVFGDFCADHAVISAGGGGKAYPHLRYTTGSHWLVTRAEDGLDRANGMRSVGCASLNHDQFDGAGYSAADREISLLGSGYRGAGTPSEWRSFAVTHHITKVVSSIGAIRGFGIARANPLLPEQLSLPSIASINRK